MQCPKCKYEKQKVVDTRPFGEQTWRKRVCKECGYVFITYEKAEETASMVYLPRNKRTKKKE